MRISEQKINWTEREEKEFKVNFIAALVIALVVMIYMGQENRKDNFLSEMHQVALTEPSPATDLKTGGKAVLIAGIMARPDVNTEDLFLVEPVGLMTVRNIQDNMLIVDYRCISDRKAAKHLNAFVITKEEFIRQAVQAHQALKKLKDFEDFKIFLKRNYEIL